MIGHYGATHMGLHIGNSYGPATFDCMKEKTGSRRDPPRTQEDMQRGARINRLRKTKDLNQTELAEKVGVDQSTVSDWENGAKFSADLLMLLSDVLGVSPSTIMRGQDQVSWPFEHIPIELYLAIDEDQKPFIEGRLMEYILQGIPPNPPGSKSLKTRARPAVARKRG
jgi:transcriptional regulator with XRE-family HTH domain